MTLDLHALPYNFQPGDRVGTNCGVYRHVGTVSERRWIYANSRKFGQLCEVSPYEFSGGRPIENDGFPALRSRYEVLAHLRSKLGTPYQLFDYNCEHANNEAHGFGRRSPQIQNAANLFLGLGVAAVCIAAARR